MENLSLSQIVSHIKRKKFSAKELVQFYLNKTEKLNPKLHAFITINKNILKEAETPKEGRLQGVPIGIKDMFCTQGMRTTAGSRMLENFTPAYSATVVERLKQEGALILGKCNQDEFAMGSRGEHSYFGVAKNPWNIKCTAGGSSGGSASAVAGGLCPASFGTDTGGSVRQPAHFCSLVGFKPSYGRISRYGIIAFASSLDQASCFTNNIEDACLLTDVVTGRDSQDLTTSDRDPTEFHKNLNPQIKSYNIGYFPLEEYEKLNIKLDDSIKQAQTLTLDILKKRGCTLKPCSWPYIEHALSAYYLISTSEASSNLSRYDGIRYGFRSPDKSSSLKEFYSLNRGQGFGKEVKQRILTGTFCLSSGYYEAYYQKASQVRRLISDGFKNIFKNVDAVVCPVAAKTAYPLHQETSSLKTYQDDIFTVFANLAGLPALSLPCTFSKDNMPVGIQLMGQQFEEQTILNIAQALEDDLNISRKKPDVC